MVLINHNFDKKDFTVKEEFFFYPQKCLIKKYTLKKN